MVDEGWMRGWWMVGGGWLGGRTVCRQSEHDNAEEDLDAAKAEDECWSDHIAVR
jgi:hypothetical protein